MVIKETKAWPGKGKRSAKPALGGSKPQDLVSSSEYIKSITALKRQTNHDEALFLLNKVASLVKPIMKKYGYKVGTLCEFLPKNPNLLGLNVNHGVKICIRLRYASNTRSFYPLGDLVGTMLHELTHNQFGAHDAKFYAQLDKLKRECEDYLAAGYTGDGFYSNGYRLGVGSSNVSFTQAREKAVKAAETRAILFKGSGQKLGGESIHKKKSMKELILEAAERRSADSKWCASQDTISDIDLGLEDDDIQIVDGPSTPKRNFPAEGKENESSTYVESQLKKPKLEKIKEIIDLTLE